MDGWMDELFFFCLSSTHTTLPLIKLVERSKLFQTSFVSFFFLSLSLSPVCVLWLIEVEGARGMFGIYRICPRECCWWRRLCVCESGPEMRKSVCVCVCILSLFIFFSELFSYSFLFFFFLCALTCFMWIVAVGRNGILHDNYLFGYVPSALCCRLLLLWPALEVMDLALPFRSNRFHQPFFFFFLFFLNSWTRQMFFLRNGFSLENKKKLTMADSKWWIR